MDKAKFVDSVNKAFSELRIRSVSLSTEGGYTEDCQTLVFSQERGCKINVFIYLKPDNFGCEVHININNKVNDFIIRIGTSSNMAALEKICNQTKTEKLSDEAKDKIRTSINYLLASYLQTNPHNPEELALLKKIIDIIFDSYVKACEP